MSARPSQHELDPRAWLVWGMAVSLPLLTGRHPVLIAELLIIVLVVRSICVPAARRAGWSWLLRLGMIAVPIGIVFNMLTVHAGERELFRVPGDLPLIGGTVTLNAVVYGVLSGLAIVVLVAAGTTVAAALDWSALVRLIPTRAANIAVAGSVAWAFLPQLATSWREIREAQAARGHRFRGARDAVPLVVPLLAGGLDRSVTMAEALESRGFGATAAAGSNSSRSSIALAGALTTAVLGIYLLAVGRPATAGVALLITLATGAAALRLDPTGSTERTTRYRSSTWRRVDTTVTAGAVLATLATAMALQIRPAAVRYDPYPTLDLPVTSLWLVLALALLMLPAAVAPAPHEPGAAR